jgi:hypothetical protein
MDITIDVPIFYHPEDENIFFSCIYRLPDYKQVRGQGRALTISFNQPLSNEAIAQLLVICRRWHISPDALMRFKGKENAKWSLWCNEIPK